MPSFEGNYIALSIPEVVPVDQACNLVQHITPTSSSQFSTLLEAELSGLVKNPLSCPSLRISITLVTLLDHLVATNIAEGRAAAAHSSPLVKDAQAECMTKVCMDPTLPLLSSHAFATSNMTEVPLTRSQGPTDCTKSKCTEGCLCYQAKCQKFVDPCVKIPQREQSGSDSESSASASCMVSTSYPVIENFFQKLDFQFERHDGIFQE